MFSANSSQVSDDKLFVEDVFSTYLYSGTSGAQSINNGIDTLNKGGLVWMKNRGSALSHILIDTAQGSTFAGGKTLISNSTNAAGTVAANTFQFDSTGFSFGSAASGGAINASGNTYASWTFREAPKFFDVVTYTGNGTAGRQIAHSLGVAPGFIIVKRTDAAGDWICYHRGVNGGVNPEQYALYLNYTYALGSDLLSWNSTAPTSTAFTVGSNVDVNSSGATYVAYLFAHDTTSDGIIQCGSFTANGGTVSVNLGWEPQWLLVKRADSTSNWFITDNMRGLSNGNTIRLQPNTSSAEGDEGAAYLVPTATGFNHNNYFASGANVIYIAIRRGPMRTPTSGTSVFAPVTRTGTGGLVDVSVPITTDLVIIRNRSGSSAEGTVDRLRGLAGLETSDTTQEQKFELSSSGYDLVKFNQTGYTLGQGYWANLNGSGTSYVDYNFRRAPGFFDEVCWTGNGAASQTLNHNLGVTPELIIQKARSTTSTWFVYQPGILGSLRLNTTAARDSNAIQSATSTTFNTNVATSGVTYVSYLFASAPGVSKVGSYTGNGSSQTINCGFAAGARFVMIKRTDSTGDWYVWDSARGIVAGNDPRLSLNSTSAEVTTDDSVDTDSSGFVVNQLSATNINVSSATYIYLAVA